MEARKHQSRWAWWVAFILLLWLLFAQALGAARAASITFDEGPHLAVGYATLRSGDLRLQPVHIHPPLANVLAAAPLLLNPELPDPRTIPGWEIASLSAVTDTVVWQYPHPARLALVGRLPIILLTVVTGALVARWAADLGGAKAGLVALGLYTLDPNIIAHGSLITTDMAVTTFGLLTFFLLHRYLRRPAKTRLLTVGLALGMALASKVSAVLLVALVGAVLLVGRGRRVWRQSLQAWLGASLVAFLALWAFYGFELRTLLNLSGGLPVPAATHLDIYRSLQEHYRLGHPAFLMGQNSDQGWWFYFPVAFAVKTPLPTLILLGLALIVFIQRRHSINLTLTLFPPVHFATALFSSVDIGYRHLLPVLPFVYVFVAYILRNAYTAGEGRNRHYAIRIVQSASILWLAAGTALVYPYPLTYFNELAGGPEGGYRWLVDSNLDWGQNLWQLRDWMQAESVEWVYYSHFSPARPQVYGVNADWLLPDPRAVPFAPFDPPPGVYAIGATTLQGVYTPDVNTFAFFRAQQPDAILGHALFLYRVPEHPAPDWAAACYDVPLSDRQIRARFGQPNLRPVFYDCAQSQVYPAGDEGRYLLPPEADWPYGTTLLLQARHAGGRPAFSILRAETRPIPQTAVRSVDVDGPLSFLGYQLDQATARRSEQVTVRTFWRVEWAPNRPLSLMAHLLRADGAPVAVGDGLGVPVEGWQPGDQIVQTHRLALPPDLPAGEYTLLSGAYWLDTLESWSIHLADGSISDHFFLDKITILD